MIQSGALPAARERRRLNIPAASVATLFLGLLALLLLARRADLHAAQQPVENVYDVRAHQVTTNDQHEPTLAVDPTNPNNVLAASKDWRTGPKQVWHYRSTDAGRTWADGHINSLPSELPNQSDPVITFDASGNAYMAIIGYNQNDFSVGGIFVTRSSDAGATWQPPVVVSGNSEGVFNDKEWMAVDRSNNPATKGNIYVSWTLFTNTGRYTERGAIVISRSTDGGKTFSPRKVISLQGQVDVQGSYPAIGPNGEVYVLYYSDQGEGGSNATALYIAKSTDGGATFPSVRKVSNITFPPSPLPGSKFRIFILPTLAVDPRTGALYATWNDYRNGDTDVLLASSTNGGQTWSEPKRVNNDPAGRRSDQFFPTLIVGSDSAVHLLWLDRRDDPNNKKYVPYYARSTDGGSTFSQNYPVARVQSDPDVGFQGTLIGDYIAIDVSGDAKRVYTAWVDTRNGDQDIYFSAFDAQAGQGVNAAQTPVPTRSLPSAAPSPQPLSGFMDEAFRRKWERADRPVLTGAVRRPWLWGPISFAAATEPYAQGRGGVRDVQYFDKSRMEINNAAEDASNPSYVTNGLLVVELISGRIQIGNQQFATPRPPAQVPVAGDSDSPDALTYASLAPVASLNADKRATDRTGQTVTTVLNRAGQVRDDPARGGAIKLVKYEPTIGHNIPDVFWAFMNASGQIYDGRTRELSEGKILDWVTDLGLPITEPYWTSVKIGGAQKWVLVQAFQRRVLTYVADNPPGWQVEMGNVGRHYFDWRYNGSLP